MQVLEAGFDPPGRACVLLLHGFPELAYSWRKVMPPLAAAGFHVVAPDQRGYGRTNGADTRYDGDLAPFRIAALAGDAAGLLGALSIRSAHVVGHDFGSPVAAACALIRPDLFRSVALMSAPYGGSGVGGMPASTLDGLAALKRKHYQWYYATREADRDMRDCPQGVHAFLRAYYHVKSADWEANRPFPLKDWSAQELAKLPRYYVMDLDRNMAETVAADFPDRSSPWLSDDELKVYSESFAATGFQGGLQWYRCATGGLSAESMRPYAGRTIDIPSCFIAGASDWGIHQKPGELERMQESTCTDFRGCHLVPGAGHWVQQEQPEKTAALLLQFLASVQ